MSTLTKKIHRNLRYRTWPQVIQRRLHRLGIDVVFFYIMRETGKGIHPPRLKGSDAEYRFRFLEPAEVEEISRLPELRLHADGVREAMAAGNECLVALHMGLIVASCWATFGSWEFWRKRFPLKKNEAYLSTMFTLKSHRGKNIAPRLRYEMYRALNRRGVDTFYSISEVLNAPAVRFKKKLNARSIRLCVALALFGRSHRIITLKRFRT